MKKIFGLKYLQKMNEESCKTGSVCPLFKTVSKTYVTNPPSNDGYINDLCDVIL